MSKAIEIKGVTRCYGSLTALDNVSFSVEHGEMFGLIGPDGAGKSTLYKLLATLLPPDSGTAYVTGLDIIKDYRKLRTRMRLIL